MRAHCNKTKCQILFFQDEVIADGKKTNIQYGIGPATGRIAKRLQRENSVERHIKEVDQI
jgi:hypothetical protein